MKEVLPTDLVDEFKAMRMLRMDQLNLEYTISKGDLVAVGTFPSVNGMARGFLRADVEALAAKRLPLLEKAADAERRRRLGK